MSKVTDAILENVIFSVRKNEDLFLKCIERGSLKEDLEFIARMSKEAREDTCDTIRWNKIDEYAFFRVINHARYVTMKFSDLNIARAIKLTSLNNGSGVEDLVKEFLKLVKNPNRSGVAYLYDLAIYQRIPWYIAEILFAEYAHPGSKFKFADTYEWAIDCETCENVKVLKKGLYSFVEDIIIAVEASYADGMNDSSIADIIKRSSLLAFVYG